MGVETVQNLKQKMETLVEDLMWTQKNANWWRNVYDSLDDRFHITRENLKFILNTIQLYIEKYQEISYLL